LKMKWQILCLAVVALFGCAHAQPIIGGIGQIETPFNMTFNVPFNTQFETPPNDTVLIQLASFQPESLTVPAGTEVTWINRDIVRHTVTSDEGLFDSGDLGAGESFSYTFDKPGTYGYHCTRHPFVHGTIIVTETKQPPAEQPPAEQPLAKQFPAGQPQVMQTTSEQIITGQPSGQSSSIQQLVIVPEQPQPAAEDFSQFYRSEPQPTAPEQLTVEQYAVSGTAPQEVYFGGPQQQAVSYSEYEALATTAEPNALWIQGRDTWVRYVQVPRGSALTLLATTQTSGPGTFYQIFPSGGLDQNGFFLYPFSAVNFYAEDVGQHFIFFVKDNVPSNVVIIDVQPFAPPAVPFFGRARVNIVSSFLTGYDVYVDDVYQFTEGAGGIPDGRSSFTVAGDMAHKITIRSGGLTYTSSGYFSSGQTYSINLF
jgi:hypothetical protein